MFSLFVFLLLYIFCEENFFIEGVFIQDYIQEIQNACKTLQSNYFADQFPQINHYLLLLDILLHSHFHKLYLFEANLDLLANTSTPDVSQYHIEQNLSASCLRCWSTGLTKREIPMQYLASTEMYTNKCIESQVCNDCTYRWNSISEVSLDFRLSLYFPFKVLSTFQDNMSRIFRIVLFIVYLHTRRLA